jgi:hypothetical protein
LQSAFQLFPFTTKLSTIQLKFLSEKHIMHLDVVSPFGHGHFEHWSMRHRYNHVHLRLHLNCECNRPSMRAVHFGNRGPTAQGQKVTLDFVSRKNESMFLKVG